MSQLIEVREPSIISRGDLVWTLRRGGRVIDEWRVKNLIVDEGLNYLLDAGLSGGAQISTWYVGLFKGNYTPQATDTASNIASNSTEATEYDETNRVQWVSDPVSGKAIANNSTLADFTINATVTIYGGFLISDSVKGGTTGTLLAAARFPTQRDLVASDILSVRYTISASSA